MKKKTKKIVVEKKEYVYVINSKYEYVQGVSNITLSISLKEQKNVTCLFRICTWEDVIAGSPLLVGVSIMNVTTKEHEKFNLHSPKIVRQFVLYGLENGWDGSNRMEFKDGLEIISRLGYDISWLKPAQKLC
ncbi:hypothetical protein I6N90_01550 [Paenibacillus sp. GSMTC-2017]|uniref:hypothetical protein n=1 Tax=Paenibacillus sp. GSMTC-2017 TaxID=2794350 RepID=UPI0018D6C843|nr:hypothetical protein [Paenibacillus sp. GSMTC-2017]MBH5316489.1 hypothetical protein [Paenibacillus sp. GSMTC-2017]